MALDWTLFDGMQMFINHERLGEQERLGMDELRFRLETTLEQIISAYVNIIRINEQLNVLSNSVDVTRQRIEIAETKLDLGSGSEYELLQARTDLNADRAAVLRERNRLVEAKIILNELIALQPDQDYEVASDIELNRNLTYNELHSRMASGNASLQLARTEHRIARLDVREIRSERFPEIELNSGYSFNRTDGGGGFLRYNEAAGFNIGITARINLFDGFNTSRRIQNAKINLKNRDLLFEEEKQRVDANFLSAFRTYENSLELVELEENNMEFAEETLDIALERFRLGTISALEFREAQRAYLSAESRLIEAKYDAKVAETELLRLTGDLRHIAM
ncbi:MAG: TolC family protein [Balneolaceae bacterium]